MVALWRSLNIPAGCVFGWVVRSKHGYHAWVEHYDKEQKRWISSDPSVAHLGHPAKRGRRTKLDAGFGFINDERIVFSIGEDLELEGREIKWRVPLLQSPAVVSLNELRIPIRITDKFDWKVIG